MFQSGHLISADCVTEMLRVHAAHAGLDGEADAGRISPGDRVRQTFACRGLLGWIGVRTRRPGPFPGRFGADRNDADVAPSGPGGEGRRFDQGRAGQQADQRAHEPGVPLVEVNRADERPTYMASACSRR